ncbi:MAG: VCBS repeat-containing protein [Xanthomonadaceae bacterium]|nr:VCBS repeat-containing protein [Xanthomonadaceae bacterium]
MQLKLITTSVIYIALLFFSAIAAAQSNIDPFTAPQGPLTVGPGQAPEPEEAVLTTSTVLGGFRVMVPTVNEEAPAGSSLTAIVDGGQFRCEMSFPVNDPETALGGCGLGYDRSCGNFFDFSEVDAFIIDIQALSGAGFLSISAGDRDLNSVQAFDIGSNFDLVSLSEGTLRIPRTAFFSVLPGGAFDWANVDNLLFTVINDFESDLSVQIGSLGTEGSIGVGSPGGEDCPDETREPDDLVFFNEDTGDVEVWQMDGTERVSVGLIPGISDPVWSLFGIGDFDGDGRNDFLWRAPSVGAGQNRIWLIEGDERVAGSNIPSIGPEWMFAGTGDFNGDGRKDILWRETMPVTGQNRAWLMDGLTRQEGDSIPLLRGEEWIPGGVGDFNGDGRDDILWRSTERPQTRIWLMDSFERGNSAAIPLIQNTWSVAGIGDFDGDGNADILWRDEALGQNRIWLLDGLTIKARDTINLIGPASWQVAGIGDLDGDGRADIVWRNAESGQNRVWLMDGLVRKQGAAIPFQPDTNWRIVGVGNTD